MRHWLGLFTLVFAFASSCQNSSSRGSSKNDKSSEASEKEIRSQAQLIVQFSAQTLLEKLKSSIAQKGLLGAVDFCKLEAAGISDSLSLVFGVDIKRVSEKNRNPSNAPEGDELEYLHQFEEQGEEAESILIKKGARYTYFAPIRIAGGLCLNCHGIVGETMSVEQSEHINEEYPNDKAIGYSLGDLRGMWRITYN